MPNTRSTPCSRERADDRLAAGHARRSAASEIISWQTLAASHAVIPLGS